MLDEAPGESPIEKAVFSLKENLIGASHLEGRSGAINALIAIAEFLSLISAPGEIAYQRPINELVSALISLGDGKVLPLLEPVRRSGGPLNSIAKESAKGAAAFVVKRLCDGGMAARDAYEKVALVCRQAGLRPGRLGARDQRAEMTGRTVRGWVEEIQADVGYHSRAGRQYASLVSVLPALRGPVDPDQLLDSLRRFLAGKP